VIDYDPHLWRDHLLDIKGSMVRQVIGRVLSCVLWSAAITYVHFHHVELNISDKAHLLVGTVLGLLLVFRTNSSYDRFWEGRKLWGSIINETRNLGRAAAVLLEAAPDLLRRLLGWTILFPGATMQVLRGRHGLGTAPGWLPPEEVYSVRQADHQPLAIARRISGVLDEARRRGLISDYVQMQLDQNVQLLVDYLGACERIHRTPLPFAYMVHLRRCLILYCFTLPFALLDIFGWGTIPVTMLVAYTMFGIEEIGVEIEDPFGFDENDLPLERFCATIERNLLELMPPEPVVPPDGQAGQAPVPAAPAGHGNPSFSSLPRLGQ
jgi:putative membrane protein